MTWLYLLFFLVWIIVFPHQMIGLRMARVRLQAWADRHRLKVVECREAMPTWKGSFAARTSSQVLYQVVVEDDTGQRRSAWVLCGSPWRGSWVDQVDVLWDKGDTPPLRAARRFGFPGDARLLVESMRSLGVRGLLLGPCLGLGIGVVMLLLTGLIPSQATIPMLIISAVMGVIVGGGLGVAGGLTRAWISRAIKPKATLDE
jgi:hypothetical protein